MLRLWGAPVSACVFVVLWWLAESSRIRQNLSEWDGLWTLVLISAAICASSWSAALSLALTGILLIAQLVHLVPGVSATTWPIYIGAFLALAFMLWTGGKSTRLVSVIGTAAFTLAMAFLMVSRGYGNGVGWFRVQDVTAAAMIGYWWQCLAVLLGIGSSFAAVGLLLALDRERRRLLGDRDQAEALLKRAEVELILEQERSRISRDLHDILAHSLAVITAQADGSRYARPDLPADTMKALTTIAGSARKAMADAQRVITATDDEGKLTPNPGLNDLETLLERSGLDVRRVDTGTPGVLTEMQELAVYRVVQEALTNALRHGRATSVDLALNWSAQGLSLAVSSPLPPVGAAISSGSGRGIPGMKERTILAGGTLTAGRQGDRFVVDGYIPCFTSESEEVSGVLALRDRMPTTSALVGPRE